MGGLDAMRETFGGDISPDLAFILALFFGGAVLVGFLHFVGYARKHPVAWLLMLGNVAFWPLALSGRGWLAFGTLMASLIAFSWITGRSERAAQAKQAGVPPPAPRSSASPDGAAR